MRHWPGFCLFLLTSLAQAGNIEQLEVEHEQGRYSIHLTAVLEAGSDAVFGIITDYDRLHELSDSLIESRLLSSTDAQHLRRLVVTHSCILVFCFETRMVADVTLHDRREIISEVDARESDYRYGWHHWTLTPLSGTQTRVQFDCEKEPSFWVPPVIGPWLIRHHMRSEILKSMQRIEQLAQNA